MREIMSLKSLVTYWYSIIRNQKYLIIENADSGELFNNVVNHDRKTNIFYTVKLKWDPLLKAECCSWC